MARYSSSSYSRRINKKSRARRGRRLQGLGETSRQTRLTDVVNQAKMYKKIADKVLFRSSGGESSSSSSSRARTTVLAPQIQQDYRRSAIRYGKKYSVARTAKKLTRTNIHREVYSLRNYGPWNRGLGAIPIVSSQPLGTGTDVECPVHLWELTAAPQGTRNQVSYPATFYRLFFNSESASGTHYFRTYSGAIDKAANSYNMQDVDLFQKEFQLYPSDSTKRTYFDGTSDINKDVGPGTLSFIEKFNMKLILNGPQQRATKWCIQLVQLAPEVTPGNTVVSPNGNVAEAFWQQMSKPYGFSPLESGPTGRLRKYFKVLKSMYVTMDAPENSEDHISCRLRHIDFSGFLNRKANYNWSNREDTVSLNSDDIPENAQLDPSDRRSTHVHPRARVYVMIRALCTLTGDTYTPAQYPSYDIKLDVHHRHLD